MNRSALLKDAAVTMANFATSLGWMAAAGRGETLTCLTIGHRSAPEALRALARMHGMMFEPARADRPQPDWDADAIVRRLKAYASGMPDDFEDVKLDLAHLTPFARRVIRHCRRIPYGATITYGDLALRAGAPGAARAVGNIMAANRYPLIVPCHRVVASGGGLGGYSAVQGIAFKQRLLTMEARGASQSPILAPAAHAT